MKRLTCALVALSLVGCVGDDSTTPPDSGADVQTDAGTTPDAPLDSPQETAPTCTGSETACGSVCVDLQTDNGNCGACGHACESGTTCSTGFCPPVTVCNGGMGNGSNTADLALYKGSAYFAYGKQVSTCNLAVTKATASDYFSSALNGYSVTSVFGDSQFFYFTNHIITSNSNGLTRCDGVQSDTTFVQMYPSTWSSDYVRTDDDRSTGQLYASLSTEANLVANAPDAGQPTKTCVPSLDGLSTAAAGGGRFFYVDSTKTLKAVTVTNQTCSSPKTVAGSLTLPAVLGVQGQTVAFADASGSVYACDASLGCMPEGAPTPLVTGQGSGVLSVVLDTATPPNVYWIGSKGLMRCSSSSSACNGTPLVLVPNATPTVGMAVDATNVYYLQGAVLMRVAK